MRKLVKGIAALLLSGMLSVASVSGSVYAAAVDVDSDLTSEIAEKVFTEEPAETSEAPAESVRASEIEEEVLPEEVPQEETVTSYTVTLDANGGCFADEWDDSIGDYVEQAEVVKTDSCRRDCDGCSCVCRPGWPEPGICGMEYGKRR